MVKDYQVAIHDIEHIGGVVGGLCVVDHIDILKVAHGIERGEAVDTAVLAARATHLETAHEVGQGMCT